MQIFPYKNAKYSFSQKHIMHFLKDIFVGRMCKILLEDALVQNKVKI